MTIEILNVLYSFLLISSGSGTDSFEYVPSLSLSLQLVFSLVLFVFNFVFFRDVGAVVGAVVVVVVVGGSLVNVVCCGRVRGPGRRTQTKLTLKLKLTDKLKL